jgi:flagellar basal-body rod modification protein FlgD
VVVNLPQGGLATVRVIDSQNNEIRTLYAGILPAGTQTFTWDGKTTEGLVAPPGHYFVEIKSGTDVMRQELHLEQATSPQ